MNNSYACVLHSSHHEVHTLMMITRRAEHATACIIQCTYAAHVTRFIVLTPVVSFHSFSCASQQESVC